MACPFVAWLTERLVNHVRMIFDLVSTRRHRAGTTVATVQGASTKIRHILLAPPARRHFESVSWCHGDVTPSHRGVGVRHDDPFDMAMSPGLPGS